ncbi:MAG: hypothetical protein MZU97_27090 [Bacillus subtilis]|nr:hypothetical protein [Bacillus subtilis]
MQLIELAGRLGADIPFLLQGGMAQAREPEGISGRLRGLKVILWRWQNRTRGFPPGSCTERGTRPIASVAAGAQKKETGSARFLKALSAEGAHAALKCLHNGFEDLAIGMLPSIGRLKRMMFDAGAISASMSGSGTAVFGVFEDEMAARVAIETAGANFKGIFTAITRLDGNRGLPMLK